MTNRLRFGLRDLPEDLSGPVWGARLIWPNDLVWDRQDIVGSEAERTALANWLNNPGQATGPLRRALDEAARLAQQELRQSDDRTVTLYEDERGIVRGNPQGSFGYLYVAAWLKPAA